MELLPVSAPVYGGGLIVAFLSDDYILPDKIRAFLVFEGNKQRQVTEAKISIEDNALHAVIPDHEPPECVTLSAYVQLPDSSAECIATEEFTYFLDQTCYLAKYLADSVCDFESLEDWDNIRGDNFSLENEDFSSLDERLTSAFQHLILPSDWNLLGVPEADHVPRETLFHFASRLGLSTFVTLLLEKPGAELCLQLCNKHGELATDIAKSREFDGLADLMTDPHAHGVIKWESKEKIGHAVVLTRHSFGTVSTTAEIIDGVWPPLSVEIEALSQTSAPPATPIPYKSYSNILWNEEQNDSFFSPSSDVAHKRNCSTSYELLPEYHDRGFQYLPHSSTYENESESTIFLDSNTDQLCEINREMQHLQSKDFEKVKEEDDETSRLSNSCPDLAQSSSHVAKGTSENATLHDFNTSIRPRNRSALPLNKEEELEQQLLSDDIHQYPVAQSNLYDCPAPAPLQRRHSWHSAEDLAEQRPSPCPDRFCVSGDKDQNHVLKSSVASPTVVRRGNHKDMAMFSVVTPFSGSSSLNTDDLEGESRRSSSFPVDSTQDRDDEPGRRNTINESVTSGQEVKNPSRPSQSTIKPPVPPRPLKAMATRKISFIDKVKNSTIYKQKEKGKMKFFADGKKATADGNADAFDRTSGGLQKNQRPSIIERPKSMMINRPAQYSVGPSSNSFTSGSPRSRPISSHDGFQSNADTTETTSDRSSHYEEEDGPGLRVYQSTNSMVRSNTKNRFTGSTESLSDPLVDTSDLEKDPDLRIKSDEPDSWSATIDKKVLKKMSLSKKDSKRQENIFEFIQTEKNHLTTLKILQLIYAKGLSNELKMDQPTIQKLFPQIDKHVLYTSDFVKKLTTRQSSSKVVSGIGDIIVKQWEGTSGDTMKRLFGDFCSKQNEITNFYKELIKTDKKFHAFMKKCDQNRLTRRQDVPGCALLVTQRLTKYPIMLQTMLENTNKKEHKDDYQQLERALELSREIAKDVDEQVQAHEREILLRETYDKIDSKSVTTFKDGNRKFDRKDFLRKNRKLLYSATLQWKEPKRYIDVFFLLLSDCIVLLQDNNGRFIFPSGQPAAIPLQKMIVREVANNEKALYLMSMRSQQMYTLIAPSADDCRTLTNTIRLAIGKCPDEDEGVISEDEGERRTHDHRLDRAKQMLNQLVLTDQRINRMLEEKMSFFRALADNIGRGSATANMHFYFPDFSQSVEESNDFSNFPSGVPMLMKAIEQVHNLTHSLYGGDGPSRHQSSAGEQESGSRPTYSLPKRSDTFGGFDNGKEPSSSRAKYLNSSQSDSKLADIEHPKAGLLSSNRDSGFHSELTMGHTAGSQTSISKPWTPHLETTGEANIPGKEVDSGPQPSPYQVTALTSLARILSDYQSFAAQQDTHVERLHLQLAAGKKKTVGGGLQEAELKRNQIKQQEQMDDLRKQQQQFRTEKEQWQRQVERFQRSLETDQAEVSQEREQNVLAKEEIERERAEIAKAKEYYQSELNRLRQSLRQNQQSHDSHASPSTSSLSSTNKNNNNSDVLHLSKSQSTLPGLERPVKTTPSPTYSAAEYPRTFPGPKKEQHPPPLPLHLQLSAANLTSNPQAVKSQDISKLSKLASSSKASGGNKQGAGDKGVIHQLIPHKLSKLANPPSSSKKHHVV